MVAFSTLIVTSNLTLIARWPYWCQSDLNYNVAVLPWWCLTLHVKEPLGSPHLALCGPTLLASKEELALIEVSGILPDCMPNALRQFAGMEIECHTSLKGIRTDCLDGPHTYVQDVSLKLLDDWRLSQTEKDGRLSPPRTTPHLASGQGSPAGLTLYITHLSAVVYFYIAMSRQTFFLTKNTRDETW